MHNRTILSQLRQLRHLVDKTTSNAASSSSGSQGLSSNGSSLSTKNSTIGNSKKTGNGASNSASATTNNSSAYLMVFLACFAALFAGQPDYSNSSNSNSQLISSSSPKGHIVDDLSTFGSLHQVRILLPDKHLVALYTESLIDQFD